MKEEKKGFAGLSPENQRVLEDRAVKKLMEYIEEVAEEWFEVNHIRDKAEDLLRETLREKLIEPFFSEDNWIEKGYNIDDIEFYKSSDYQSYKIVFYITLKHKNVVIKSKSFEFLIHNYKDYLEINKQTPHGYKVLYRVRLSELNKREVERIIKRRYRLEEIERLKDRIKELEYQLGIQ